MSPDLRSTPGSKEDDYVARHLLKYIFPLQYKMENVFESQPGYRERFERRRFADRDAEITVRFRGIVFARLIYIKATGERYLQHSCSFKEDALLSKQVVSKPSKMRVQATIGQSVSFEGLMFNTIREAGV